MLVWRRRRCRDKQIIQSCFKYVILFFIYLFILYFLSFADYTKKQLLNVCVFLIFIHLFIHSSRFCFFFHIFCFLFDKFIITTQIMAARASCTSYIHLINFCCYCCWFLSTSKSSRREIFLFIFALLKRETIKMKWRGEKIREKFCENFSE